MAYAFIHGEVKGSGASVEFKGNGLDLLDLTIQIVGSVVAEVPQPLRPYVIKKIQDKIPDAVQNDLEAQGKAAPAEKKEKPPVGETVGFRMARQFAETEPGFKDFITDDQETYHTAAEMEKLLGYTKRCTAHLEHIIYTIEPHERSPAYIAAVPCGMATSCTVKVPGRIKPREVGAKAYVAGAVGRSKMQVAVALPGAVEAKAVKARAFTAGTVERSHTAINIVIGGQTT